MEPEINTINEEMERLNANDETDAKDTINETIERLNANNETDADDIINEPMESLNANDETDAKGLFGRSKTPPDPSGSVIGSVADRAYSMKYPKRGRCLIFNHKNFRAHTGLNTRNGTDADAARLYCRFRELNFEVSMHTDLTVDDVQKELKLAGKQDHKDNSCLVCCILSHGEQGVLFAADGKYSTDSVFAPFRGDVCTSLAGKPKLFFIQACQGDQLDCGVNVVCREGTDGDEKVPTFKIPICADFLIVFSTVPGYYSWRNTSQGSWFIQALCESINNYRDEEDLLSILTIVNHKVAYNFESYTPHDPIMHLKKQIPMINSTLTRKIMFKNIN